MINSTYKFLSAEEAELSVFKAVKKLGNPEHSIAMHRYPMFPADRYYRREIDVLYVQKDLGLCVIEVKSIGIEQITRIEGATWHYKGINPSSSQPFQQAEKQIELMCKELEKIPVLYKRLTKRVFVALPNITLEQWKNSPFSELLHVPTPILKEDLEDLYLLQQKLEGAYLKIVNSSLNNLEFNKIKKALGYIAPTQTLKSNNFTQIKKIVNSHSPIKKTMTFSKLYIIDTLETYNKLKATFTYDLQHGIKHYICSYVKLPEDIKILKEFKETYQWNEYIASANAPHLKAACFQDGEELTKDDKMLSILEKAFPTFNRGQYEVIHQPINQNQMITAGAGTGKTHVMIDRILFLLIHGSKKLADMSMITFTNASTHEMKKRLEEKLISLFKVTRKPLFLHYAEEAKAMQISTIHTFAKSILTSLSHEIGFGQNLSVRNYVYEKQQIIKKLIADYYATRPVEQFLKFGIEKHDFISIVIAMWNEMEKKALNDEELNWGDVLPSSKALQDLLRYIFKSCETELNKVKSHDNSLTTDDLIRKLKPLIRNEKAMKQLSPERYLFVDEFQDSDSVQIELFATLSNHLQLRYRLFVVGDIKQAIYRFRGADNHSFDELKRQTPEKSFKVGELQINYRSSASLLAIMHEIFKKWESKGLLTYKEKDRLTSIKESVFSKNNWTIMKNGEYKEQFLTALQQLPTKKDKLAFIVRTNNHAKQIKKLCTEKGIVTAENLDGTFFMQQAVLDFTLLVDGLLYPNEPKSVVNALMTPYFGYNFSAHHFIEFEGQALRIMNFIHKHVPENHFLSYVADLRNYSPMTVIQKIIYKHRFFDYLDMHVAKTIDSSPYNSEDLEKQIHLETLRYKKNLQHLMVLIETTFTSQSLTLHTLSEWLHLQIVTNRQENEPILSQENVQVEITTVHRSKGLEYHTVFLPITMDQFNRVETKYLIENMHEIKNKADKRSFGWSIENYQNENYNKLKNTEQLELMKEQTRILYVALTRAKERIFITMDENVQPNSWAGILALGDVKAKG